MMMKLLYLEINIMCILVVLILYFSMKKNATMLPDEKVFRILLLAAAAVLMCDAVGWVLDGNPAAWVRPIIIAANTLYYLLMGAVAYIWMLFTDYKLYEDGTRFRRRARMYAIPLAVLSVMALATPFTKWLFYLDSGNHYYRGKLFIVQMVIAWGMIALSGVLALIQMFKEHSEARRRECRILMSFILLPLVGGIVQALYYGLSLVWACITVSLLFVFVNTVNKQISIDGLTGVNNRRTLNKYLYSMAAPGESGRTVRLLMIGIADLKAFNDKNGRAASDELLKKMAGAMKRVCGKHGHFLARYSESEFAIICVNAKDGEIAAIKETILNEVSALNASGELPQQIKIRIDCASLKGTGDLAAEQLISEADRGVYDKPEKIKQ